MTGVAIAAPRRVRPDDVAAARELLRTAGLPLAGLAAHFEGFWARPCDGWPARGRRGGGALRTGLVAALARR
jgi:hypothetical protein